MDDKVLTKTDTRIVDKQYVEDCKGDLFCLIKDYFTASGDTAATPGAVLLDMIEKVGKPGYILIVHELEIGHPDSFLVGKLIGNTARVITAFLGKNLDSKKVIKEFLDLFDGWAKENKCVSSDAYTHRHVKSYRALIENGWRHAYTVYRKDYHYE